MTRRGVLSSIALPASAFLCPGLAQARGLEAYIKKKKTDPLESYVPAIIVAQDQLLNVPAAAREFGLPAARELLRGGAFVGLRDNIRAVGEYATEASFGAADVKGRVTAFFKSLEAVDNAIFLAIRSDAAVPDNLQDLVDACNAALERVLDTVPDDALQTGKQIVEVIQSAAPVIEEGELGPDAEAAIKRLSGLL